MSLLTAIVQEALITSLVTGKIRPRPNKAVWCLRAISALSFGTGIFLILTSAYRFLGARFAADLAALLTAVCAFTLATLTALVAFYLGRRKNSDKRDLEKYFYKMVRNAQKEMSHPIEENPKTAIALAAALGFIFSQLKS